MKIMKIIKIFLWIILFSIFYLNTNALNIEVNTDKNDISIWEIFDLNIKIEWNISSDFNLWDIKWIENFDIINRSQSQSNASKIVIINWEKQSESKTIYNIYYKLQANKKWDFVIWPIILTNSGSNISTNPINISVDWKSLFLQNKIKNNIIDNKTNLNIITDKKETNDKILYLKYIKNILFMFIVFILLFTLFYYLKNKNKVSYFIKSIWKNIKQKFYNLKNTTYDKNNIEIEAEVIKEKEYTNIKKDKEDEIYPSKYDKNFIYKLEEIFRIKLKEKYKIKDINNKTYIDIISEIEDEKYYNKEKIKMLSNLFNKAKYSKISVNKNELIELVKNYCKN